MWPELYGKYTFSAVPRIATEVANPGWLNNPHVLQCIYICRNNRILALVFLYMTLHYTFAEV